MFTLKYPRLTYLGIGLGIGLLMTSVVTSSFNTRIEELETIRKQQLSDKSQLISNLETKYSKLETEHKKMKSHVHITERTNPDGSTERIYDSKRSVETEKRVEVHQITIQQLRYERQIDLIRFEYEKKRIEETRPSANLSVGMDNNFDKFIHVHYSVSSPVTFGLWSSQNGTYGLSFGVSL